MDGKGGHDLLHGEGGNDALIVGPGFDDFRDTDGSDRSLESDEMNNYTWHDLQKNEIYRN